MAKKSVNKAARIKEFFKANRRARNIDAIAALAKEGITVTPNYVSVVKTKGGGKGKRGGRRGRKAGQNGAVGISFHGVGVAQIKAAADLIKNTGGIQQAKAALAAAEHVARALA
jgi:hypothetical protein